MVEEAIRLIRPGLHQPKRGRLAAFLVLVLLVPIFQPVQADVSVEEDDFDELLEPQPTMSSKPVASGIELPEPATPSNEEAPAQIEEISTEKAPADVNLLRGACSSCSLEFQVPMPIDVKEAIVICPACSSEQLFQR